MVQGYVTWALWDTGRHADDWTYAFVLYDYLATKVYSIDM